MGIITWNDKYSVGIDSIDKQHKQLILLLNTLYDAMKEGKGKDKLEEILNELVVYTDYHFKYEEELFNKYSYPDKAHHEKIHNELRKKVMEFQGKFKSGQMNMSIDLLNFLKEWVNNHIVEEDKKYEALLSQKVK
jgi:hemerythrin